MNRFACELVRNGDTGFLIEGDPAAPDTVDRAAELIRAASENPALMEAVRRRAAAIGSVTIPAMIRLQYHPAFATAIVAPPEAWPL
jgi:hypothetical protein